uniref:Dihydrolipoyllysine-residue acetyltransferase component of pyruvate dehydrogenase complex n=2 Tax=Buchnera aphidicola TaxID=9 RepID=ODP2_BUCBP|nr:RecName: Full=Dihydrolipoyllysine-residue acetyltransferase component of pyruvate dehydrogenase complex; AltName: Full=Dihydrolipoamide acetyltransferase component of pyruvate dehydrogenase complex; AltName: Full=E2 [Buchnera aphidicola str. Bp (Baizongia pistaciae)]
MPDIGTDLVEVIEILVKIGDQVKKDDSLITVEGQKASIEIPASHTGTIKNIIVHIGEKITTGSLIAILNGIDDNVKSKNDSSSYSFKNSKNTSTNSNLGNVNNNINNRTILVHATPTVRRLARKFDIKLENITGTGRKGRILKEDVISYKNISLFNDIKKSLKKTNVNYYKDNVTCDDFKSIELTRTQIRSSKNLLKSWLTIPHVTQFDESDITELENFRQKYNSDLKDKSKKLTILIFVIKAVSKALEMFPKFNGRLINKDNRIAIVLNEHINIGIVVDTDDGLLVPVINRVNKKNISSISNDLRIISERARSRKLNFSDIKEYGSFTISNLGGIGGTNFTPIIKYPELAILGISRALIKPYWNSHAFIPKLMLPLSLSYDHRAIDGVAAVRFITFVKKMLTDIRFLMI